jgi:hypothetical protein
MIFGRWISGAALTMFKERWHLLRSGLEQLSLYGYLSAENSISRRGVLALEIDDPCRSRA